MGSSYQIRLKKAIILLVGILAWGFVDPVLAREPSDPQYDVQKPVWNQVHAPEAWDYSIGSRRVVIAIIDTGVDTWHPDLDKNVWVNPYEIPDNHIDDDNNGYIDDVNGWNFVENNNDVRTSVFEQADNPDAVRHGTVIAGLMGADQNDRDGVGINWQVSIMPIRAIASNGAGKLSNVLKAVHYAVNNGANVLIMSFTGNDNQTYIGAALREAYDRGVVVVAAAGNHDPEEGTGDLDAHPTYAACYGVEDSENWVLGVSAVDRADRATYFANYGTCVDIMAPGTGIFSTERYAPQFGYTKAFGGDWQGTSFAAPLVGGTAALIKSLRPDWTAKEIISAILNTADSIESVNPGRTKELGRGRLNIGAAVQRAAEGAPRITDQIYSFAQGTIFKYSFSSQRSALFTTIRNAKIISVAATPAPEWPKAIVALFDRGGFTYVRGYKQNGEQFFEWAVPKKTGQVYTGVRVVNTEDGLRILVSAFHAKQNKTFIYQFASNSNLLESKTVIGSVAHWAYTPTGLFVAQLDKKQKQLTVTFFEAGTNQTIMWRKSNVVGIDDLVAAPITSAGYSQAVLIVQSGGGRTRYIFDPKVKTAAESRFDTLGKTGSWRVVVEPTNGVFDSRLVYYQTKGGIFNVEDHRGSLIGQILIPQLKGFFN